MKLFFIVAAFLINIWFLPAVTYAGSGLMLDGRFSDWTGQANLNDPSGDSQVGYDLRYLYWGTNPGESNLYFMAQRYDPSNNYQGVIYYLYIDVNNNGSYNDLVDRYALVDYTPYKNRSDVWVDLFSASGSYITTDYGDWGEGVREGGKKCEFRLSMSDLGISPGQPIRFYITSNGSPPDRLPDSGDIQWSPVPAAGNLGLALMLTGGLILMARAVRR